MAVFGASFFPVWFIPGRPSAKLTPPMTGVDDFLWACTVRHFDSNHLADDTPCNVTATDTHLNHVLPFPACLIAPEFRNNTNERKSLFNFDYDDDYRSTSRSRFISKQRLSLNKFEFGVNTTTHDYKSNNFNRNRISGKNSNYTKRESKTIPLSCFYIIINIPKYNDNLNIMRHPKNKSNVNVIYRLLYSKANLYNKDENHNNSKRDDGNYQSWTLVNEHYYTIDSTNCRWNCSKIPPSLITRTGNYVTIRELDANVEVSSKHLSLDSIFWLLFIFLVVSKVSYSISAR